MEDSTFFLLLSFLLTFTYALMTIFRRRHSRLPPGPYPFPIVGNLLELGDKPHQTLARLSKRYGPLMSLKLGTKTTVVISSPDMVKEFFQVNDLSCLGRLPPDATTMENHSKFSLIWLPSGVQWRRLRKISKEYLFSTQRLDASELLRQKKVEELLEHVNQYSTNEKALNIGAVMFTTTVNILSNFVFSKDIAQYDSLSSQEFMESILGLLEVGGRPNLSDFFPILKKFDLQGVLRQSNAFGRKILAIYDVFIEQRLQTRSNEGVSLANNDVLDSLLNFSQKNESEFDRNDMIHLIFDLFLAGNDTTSGTLDWVMAELIRNPEKMETTRLELDKVVQGANRSIKESDIPQLPYLQAVIKETLRLHPPAPFLVPHQAMKDVEVQGYIIPKNTEILYNVWAVGRDPKIWSDPETFMPERFLDIKTDYKGQDFDLLPFGTGRRICPGLNIAHRMLHTILGSLIYKFDWKFAGNTRAQDMDFEEKFGITLQRNVPLMAIPLKRF